MPETLKLVNPWRQRLAAAGIHLAISALIALAAAALVFGVWFPGKYRVMSGGQSLFTLVVSVDVVLGPLLTFAVFDRTRKSIRHLRIDLLVIALLQAGALAYGLHTVMAVRPVALVFEVDRFRVVTATDVDEAELPQAAPPYRALPLRGPWLLSTREPSTPAERNDVLFKGLHGTDIGQRPLFWQPYGEAKIRVKAKARAVSLLFDKYPQRRAELEESLAQAGLDARTARFLPVTARGDWVALLDPDEGVAGFAPFDAYF